MKTSKLIFNIFVIFLFAISVLILIGTDKYNPKIGYKLSQLINNKISQDKNLVWIYFKDKGINSDARLLHPESFVTEKSIERRIKRIRSDKIFDESDIPVYNEYINEISACGVSIKYKSKWFNAVSCYANNIQIENIVEKDFVEKIELVQKYKKSREEELYNGSNDYESKSNLSDNPTEINYGPSFTQSNIINVPPVHDRGYTGMGILVASFDAGFDNLQHNCFDLMRSKGLRTYDFVNGDTIVADGSGRKGSGAHGTLTLSLVCGYDPGFLVSPAFNASFILAKTENTSSETHLEEDNWVAAAEWADSLGADIITSSLGYLGFTDPPSYTWQSMDGNTTLITRAADIAVGKGIIVVISSGNDGTHTTPNTLNAPADGDSVITVGAVTSIRQRASYSSFGPTVDGRIKPDVMAMGSNNITARSGPGSTGYSSAAAGTSLACPMVAGVCALLLSANPQLSPIQVRDILRTTADNVGEPPNNLMGWGIVNAESAVRLALNTNTIIVSDYTLQQNYPNPFNPSTSFRFTLKKNANISIIIYDAGGREMNRVLNNVFYSTGSKEIKFNFSEIGLSSGVYFYSLFANGQLADSKKMVLVR